MPHPINIYLLKVDNKNTRKRFEICSKLTMFYIFFFKCLYFWLWTSKCLLGKFVKKVLVTFIFETLSCVQKKLGPSLFLGLTEVVIHVVWIIFPTISSVKPLLGLVLFHSMKQNRQKSVNIYLPKVVNRNTRKRCEICSMKTPNSVNLNLNFIERLHLKFLWLLTQWF